MGIIDIDGIECCSKTIRPASGPREVSVSRLIGPANTTRNFIFSVIELTGA
jgi:hypothetical protein